MDYIRTILAAFIIGVSDCVFVADEAVVGLEGEEVRVGVVDEREAGGLAAAAAVRAEPEHGDGARVDLVQLGQALAEVGPWEVWVCE